MPNPSGVVTVTGSINSELSFISQNLQGNLSRVNSKGGIFYSLPLSSGDGISQVNSVWSSTDIFPGSGSLDLTELIQSSFEQDLSISFGDAGENVKGVKLYNPNNKILTVEIPWGNNQLTLYPSGSILISTSTGLENGDLINIFSNTSESFTVISTIIGVGSKSIVSSPWSFGFDGGFGD